MTALTARENAKHFPDDPVWQRHCEKLAAYHNAMEETMTTECNCGAVGDGKWAGVHSKYCALQLPNYKYRMHDMESNVIVRVNGDGHGEEICNTLNSIGDQDLNAQFILEAIKAYQRELRA